MQRFLIKSSRYITSVLVLKILQLSDVKYQIINIFSLFAFQQAARSGPFADN